jgi:2-keto-4-pentenoate hydratase/2-oxohepta-3-ene-1,7-dioic acid hydratase in catechol pathway
MAGAGEKMTRLYRIDRDGRTEYAVEADGSLSLLRGDPFGHWTAGDPISGGLGARGVRVLAPVAPTKIVCIGLNYKDHAAETGKPLPPEPLIFIKPPSAVIGPGDPIRLPPGVGRVDHEAELAVVIGRRARRVPRAQAWAHVLGLTAMNDVTARDLQKKDVQYTRSKGFDTFAPMGPCVLLDADGRPRTVEGWVNGTRRQSSSTAHLLFPVDQLIEFVSGVMTLEPGDVISTGTPEGIGPLAAGDTVRVSVEGVGDLINPVEAG